MKNILYWEYAMNSDEILLRGCNIDQEQEPQQVDPLNKTSHQPEKTFIKDTEIEN